MRRGFFRLTRNPSGEWASRRIAARRLARKRKCRIRPEKLVKYLLNLQHPKGAAKAKFFLAGGFSREKPEVLEAALIRHYQENEPTELFEDQFRETRIVIDAPMLVPDGRLPMVRTVWRIPLGEQISEFVTAHPLD